MKTILTFILIAFLNADLRAQADTTAANSQTEINKQIVNGFYQDLWFTNNTDNYSEYVADEFIAHDIGDRKNSLESAIEQKNIADFFWKHTTNSRTNVDFQIAEGDLVATRWNMAWDPNTLFGRILLGKGELPIINVMRIEGGKIVEAGDLVDSKDVVIDGDKISSILEHRNGRDYQGEVIDRTVSGGAETDPELQRLIRQLYVQGDFHGGILIAEGEEVIVQDAWGIADHEKGQVLTPEHRFNVNSMGKMFTAILIMRLVEEGRLELDDPLSRHLPQLDHPRSDDVSIHMLLSHRSGIPDYFINQLRGEIPMEADLPSILRTVARMEMDFEPGTMFHYSNTGYVLLGMIIERKYGKSFAEVLEEQLFRPLGMGDTVFDFDVFGDRVPKYYAQDGQVRDTPLPFFIGDGGQTSSLRDMHRFMLALGSERLLSEESWERMFTPHSLPSEVPEGAWPPPHQVPYGYGFSLPQLPYSEGSTALAVGHGGAGLGSNYAVRYLNSGRIVIVWNNMSKPPFLAEVIEYLASQHSDDREQE